MCQIAGDVMREGTTRLLRYDLTADDEAVWGWGLGCNGVIDVFVEPAEQAVQMAGAIRRAIDEQRELVAVTVIEAAEGAPASPGTRMLVEPDGTIEGSLGDPSLDAAAEDAAARAIAEDRSRVVPLGQGVDAFVEALVPPIRLLVCGAGHDAIPLVRFAAGLGWRVEVVDDRRAFLTSDRFPEATGFVPLDEPAAVADVTKPDRRTFPVVMTHNFMRDKDYLRAFLGTAVPYIGMLGPNTRLVKLLDELRREGYEPDPNDLRAVHSPAGLDLGGEGPEEIAWAIVARDPRRAQRARRRLPARPAGARSTTGRTPPRKRPPSRPPRDRRPRPGRRRLDPDGPAQAPPPPGGTAHRPTRRRRRAGHAGG